MNKLGESIYGFDRILIEFQKYLDDINKEIGFQICSDGELEEFLKDIFDDEYKQKLKEAREKGKHRYD